MIIIQFYFLLSVLITLTILYILYPEPRIIIKKNNTSNEIDVCNICNIYKI